MDATERSLLVIIDINCPLGASAAEKFLSLKDWRVRAVTDDEIEEEIAMLEKWEAKGVEVVRADYHDPCQLAMAFDMADAIFCATNYWKLLQDHSATTYTALTKMHARQPVCQMEANRNMSVIQAASMTPTLQRFVMALDPSPLQLSNGTIERTWHMHGKWYAMGELKMKYPELAQKSSFLLIGRTMDCFRDHVIKQRDGTYVLSSTIDGTLRQPWYYVATDVGNFVRALICDLPPELHVSCHSQSLSWTEVAAAFSNVSGVAASYQRNNPGWLTLFRRRDPIKADLMLEEENFINMYGYYGNLQRVLTTEKIKDLYGVTIATSNWEDYFRKVLSNPLSQASTAQQRDVNMEGTDCQAGLRTEQSIANAPAGTGGHDDLDTET